MENSKTMDELFSAEYPITKLAQYPTVRTEALGWLKCAQTFAPAWKTDATHIITVIQDLDDFELDSTLNETFQVGWEEAKGLYSLPLKEALELISYQEEHHNFDFKCENGKLYYRTNPKD